MTHEFKVGDRVRVVDDKPLTQGSEQPPFKVGDEFTVHAVYDHDIKLVELDVRGWNKRRFEPVTPVGVGYGTGAVKPKWSLLPFPALESVVRVLTFGVTKAHPANDWATNFTVDDHLDAALRHIAKARGGEARDPESGELHFTHACTRLLFIIAMGGK